MNAIWIMNHVQSEGYFHMTVYNASENAFDISINILMDCIPALE